MRKKEKKENCVHNWEWSYDCFEDAVQRFGERLDIPVKCSKCDKEGFEVYRFDKIEENKKAD